MNLNLKLDEDVLEDYLTKYYEVQRPQVETIDLQQLYEFVLLILKNQPHLFRQLYNGEKNVKLDAILVHTN